MRGKVPACHDPTSDTTFGPAILQAGSPSTGSALEELTDITTRWTWLVLS
jgi:hypothetical protein